VSVTHDAMFFASDDELVAGTHDFIEGGLLAGDVVLVHGGDHDLGVLREAWDEDPRISFVGTGDLYESVMTTIAGYQRMLDRETSAGHRVRTTGTVPFHDGDARADLEWMRYEALVARVFEPYNFSGLCRYDTRITHTRFLDHARATHDRVLASSRWQAGGTERDRLLSSLADDHDIDPLESEPVVWDGVLTGAEDLRTLRRALGEAPQALVVAANEIATNALVHGGSPVRVRIHRGAAGWLCEIADSGPGIADPYAGVDSPLLDKSEAHGRGLWLARQLTDRLTIGSGPGGGAVVRLVVRD
jgi:anti-sigma regulatory factor (Ser/Thr protein kinase)